MRGIDTILSATYDDLYEWSVSSIEDFWSTCWDFTNIISSSKGSQVLDTTVPMDDIPEWFNGARLNWAENSLWCRSSDKVAMIATGEQLKTIDS
jgi:acetoacetyl-CoA synthetase